MDRALSHVNNTIAYAFGSAEALQIWQQLARVLFVGGLQYLSIDRTGSLITEHFYGIKRVHLDKNRVIHPLTRFQKILSVILAVVVPFAGQCFDNHHRYLLNNPNVGSQRLSALNTVITSMWDSADKAKKIDESSYDSAGEEDRGGSAGSSSSSSTRSKAKKYIKVLSESILKAVRFLQNKINRTFLWLKLNAFRFQYGVLDPVFKHVYPYLKFAYNLISLFQEVLYIYGHSNHISPILNAANVVQLKEQQLDKMMGSRDADVGGGGGSGGAGTSKAGASGGSSLKSMAVVTALIAMRIARMLVTDTGANTESIAENSDDPASITVPAEYVNALVPPDMKTTDQGNDRREVARRELSHRHTPSGDDDDDDDDDGVVSDADEGSEYTDDEDSDTSDGDDLHGEAVNGKANDGGGGGGTVAYPGRPKLGKGCIAPPEDPSLCPLCRNVRVNATISTGGYLFCYTCIIEHIRSDEVISESDSGSDDDVDDEAGQKRAADSSRVQARKSAYCPVTGLPCTEQNLIRLFDE
jgi:hypothetical protein